MTTRIYPKNAKIKIKLSVESSNVMLEVDPQQDSSSYSSSSDEDNKIKIVDSKPAASKGKSTPAKTTKNATGEETKQKAVTDKNNNNNTKKKNNNKNNNDEHDGPINVGDRIYSRFPENGEWYWGTVTEVVIRKTDGSPRYSILYDDGDFVEDFGVEMGIASEATIKAGGFVGDAKEEEGDKHTKNPRSRRYRPLEQKMDIIRQFKASNLALPAFARQLNRGKDPNHIEYIPCETIRTWIRKFEKEEEDEYDKNREGQRSSNATAERVASSTVATTTASATSWNGAAPPGARTHRRRTIEFKRDLVRDYRASNLTLTEFLKECNEGLSRDHIDYLFKDTVGYWIKQFAGDNDHGDESASPANDHQNHDENDTPSGQRLYRKRSMAQKLDLIRQYVDSPFSSVAPFVDRYNKGKTRQDADYLYESTLERYIEKLGKTVVRNDAPTVQRQSTPTTPYGYMCGSRFCRFRPVESKQQIVRDYEASGLSARAFADRYNEGMTSDDTEFLVLQTFKNWIDQYASGSAVSGRAERDKKEKEVTRPSKRQRVSLTSGGKNCKYRMIGGRFCRFRSPEQKQQIVQEYEASGLTKDDFVIRYNRGKRHDHPDYLVTFTFRRWVEKFGSKSTETLATNELKRADLDETLPQLLKKLYASRCEGCTLCLKEDCSRCEACLRNSNRSPPDDREVCIRKVCCAIDIESKFVPARGFPDGWRFLLEEPNETQLDPSTETDLELPGLVLLAPNGRRYKGVARACSHNPSSLRDVYGISKAFFESVGHPYIPAPIKHPLVGRGIFQQWVDVQNRTQSVYGVIASCKHHDDETSGVIFSVEYNEESRSLANFFPNSCRSFVPASAELKSELAWGGCLAFERTTINAFDTQTTPLQKLAQKNECWSWIAPEMRYEEQTQDGVPRLTLAIRGYKLIFSVKQSTIPNAGYGVFVKAVQCTNGPDAPFELKQGELLDLGIYAPFLLTDKKNEPLTFVKNYIHSFKTEEWLFDTADPTFMFDITDNHTGDIHDEARRHIPAYVNECSSRDTPTVRAELGPEGNVHYLLGVISGEDKFSIPPNKEIEIFINYGPQYEKVRLRKGYSELPEEDQQMWWKQQDEEERGCLNEITEFDRDDVANCITFLDEMYCDDGPDVSPLVLQRSSEVVRCLKQRVLDIVNAASSPDPELGKSLEVARSLLSKLSARAP